ncbi:MAG: hypothetical protein DRP85_03160 [Candidatus Makaraimicrobium thalassicum]|nr:MAG: hypothetical protein DRP85_03160 [Candidatus Omnitrophota bacterium]
MTQDIITNPPLEEVLIRAQNAVLVRRPIMDYEKIIELLINEKGYSLNQVAAWLVDNGCGRYSPSSISKVKTGNYGGA